MDQTSNLNQVPNKAIVSMGYDNIETSVTLLPGHGSTFPDPSFVGPYNIIWWNASDYPNHTNDPFLEIVQCIAKIGDTLVVMRSQQQTQASPKNIYGKLYSMMPFPDGDLKALSYYNTPPSHTHTTPSSGGALDHTNLTNIGTHTHSAIDTHLDALGTMSVQSAGSVTITGGTITGITNMGIGTANPNADLDVQGQIELSAYYENAEIKVHTQDGAGYNGNLIISASPGIGNGGLYLTTGDTTRLTILNGGNVGIGTVNPAKKLHIVPALNGGSLELSGMTGTRGADTSAIRIYDEQLTSDTGVWSSTMVIQGSPNVGQIAPIFSIYNYKDTQLSLNVLGGKSYFSNKVGIGITPTTSAMLDVFGNIALNDNMLMLRTGDDGAHFIRWSTNKILMQTNSSIDFTATNVQTMYLTGGNVGIGTTTPGGKLDVNGNTYLNDVYLSYPSTFYHRDGDVNSGKDTYGAAGASAQHYPYKNGNDPWVWYYEDWTNTLMRLHPGMGTGTDGILYVNGNVGIGIASPAQKLSVAGIIESTTGGIKFPDGTSQTTAAGATPTGMLKVIRSITPTFSGDWTTLPSPATNMFNPPYTNFTTAGYQNYNSPGNTTRTGTCIFDLGTEYWVYDIFCWMYASCNRTYSTNGGGITLFLAPATGVYVSEKAWYISGTGNTVWNELYRRPTTTLPTKVRYIKFEMYCYNGAGGLSQSTQTTWTGTYVNLVVMP